MRLFQRPPVSRPHPDTRTPARADARTAHALTGNALTVPRALRTSSLHATGVATTLLALAIAVQSQPLMAAPQAGATTSVPAAGQDDFAARLRAVEQRLGIPATGAAQLAADPAALDLRLREIERRLAAQDAPPVTAPATAVAAAPSQAPVVSLSTDKGLSVKSADGAIDLKFSALLQADQRINLDDDANPQNDTFLWRRIRPTLQGTWGSLVGFRLTPEFAGDSASVVDAWIDLKFDPRATVRIGKVKGPLGLERLQSGNAIALIERGLPTELVPNREIGVQLQGDLAKGKLNYVAGVYNGAPDGRDGATSNPDNEFEYAARVFAEPWKGSDSVLAGLGFGVAASIGDKIGTGANVLPRLRTPGQVQVFNYGTTVRADGEHLRWTPQAYWYAGPAGLLAEYVNSSQELVETVSGNRATLDNRAWQLVGSWVITGEKASYRGVARPDQPFAVGKPGWGAFEVVARYGRLDVDDATFPVFASAASAVSGIESWGIGLNWYLTGNLKLATNLTRTSFTQGAAGGDRADEKILFTRAQVSF
ncbi:OprO/OprP family phosphate-selective porin [Luteimonas sp. RIT-PG2_3]